ncbi:MAG TPA: FHA domain-containing protein [Candidatus Polarisedimenticolaceae bacterium]|nr:FHA domain-containing protein [Candidatus Polarisedimenticolaceae bacterium]
MKTLALELNDAGVIALADAGPAAERPIVSPGLAIVDGRDVATGHRALERARLNPRKLHSRFWTRPDAGPLGRPFGDEWTHADLVHEHFRALWQSAGDGIEQVVLAVPGSYSEPQLGLLLGIAGAAGIPVTGLVDAAVAAATRVAPVPWLVHLDLRLHDVVLTELAVSDGEWIRGAVRTSDMTGLAVLRDTWAKYVAAQFVRRTRFDPLHSATTEQELYLALDGLVDELRTNERASITLQRAGRAFSLELTRGELAATTASTCDALVDWVRRARSAAELASVSISHHAAAVPSLVDGLADLDEAEPIVLGQTAAAEGALVHRREICAPGDGLPYVTRLPAVAPAGAAAAPHGRARTRPASSAAGVPTHVLWEDRAYEITGEPLEFGSAPRFARSVRIVGSTAGLSRRHCVFLRNGSSVLVRDHSTHGTFVNGRRVEHEARVGPGDRVRIGSPGVELRLIRVVGRETPPAD